MRERESRQIKKRKNKISRTRLGSGVTKDKDIKDMNYMKTKHNIHGGIFG